MELQFSASKLSLFQPLFLFKHLKANMEEAPKSEPCHLENLRDSFCMCCSG